MDIQVAVCGAGTMGSGIAQVFAQNAFPVILFDLDSGALSRAAEAIEKNLDYLLKKNKISSKEKTEIINRIQFTSDPGDCIAFLIVEAIVEDLSAKVDLLKQLALVNNEEVIFASNTSSLSITKLQEQVDFPERIAGMHFFNPAYIMPLVEIVEGSHTCSEVVRELQEICAAIGKQPVVCKDAPGFIVNRVARPYYLQSLRLAQEGVAGFEEIDAILESVGFRMGPFRLMDLIGIDINLKTSETVYEALGRPARLRPSVLQQQKVGSGMLGRKSGEGFYKY
ncbi:MAG: 3-hydroxybutyryl-CoA dehydrogenase [Chitinophagaceae bacterium]|nr:3-hydroxybutyryl-CoA dehydrogenase [Chitinophagaceae bacterium]MCO5287543.1 3-hydroxyacyl-CoA dehydrogenase NAD-binding domain-containing protein [Chitinophagaceae bacterium]MCZ2397617.1 3-hydroxybutyryl-CoA dehydrogenase [Chitinophagales bacterium]